MQDWQGKTVTIMGLGQFEHGSGLAAAMYALRCGADLVITDLKTEEQLAHQVKRVKEYAQEIGYGGEMTWVMGEHRDQDFIGVDMVIRNPGVPIASPFLQKARQSNVPVESEMTLFFKACPARIVGITGTRGKSTTTSLIAHVLGAGKQKLWWGGNIGKQSPLDFVDQVKKDDVVVLELSSWMLESLHEHELSPQVAVLLNVQEDHLNRYASMAEYAEAKSYIIAHQKPEDVAIINHGNSYTAAMGDKTKARIVWFDRANPVHGYYLKAGMVVRKQADQEERLVDISRVRLMGEHNQENVLAAVACALECGLPAKVVEQQLATFTPLPGRLQFVDEVRGVVFINDTTATTPSATVAGLRALKGKPMVVITGGADKGLDYSQAALELASQCKAIVWLPGAGTDRFKPLVPSREGLLQKEVSSMHEAVQTAFGLAAPGDMVVLSPASASFGLFKNEFDRGAQFDAAVAALRKRS